MGAEDLLKLLSFFSVGLLGGFGHCIFMCNPFVLYISSRFNSSAKGYFSILIPQFKYHLGRTSTYTFLGVIAGLVTDIGLFLTGLSKIQKFTAIIAGIFLIFYGISDFFGFKILSKIENNSLTRKVSHKIGKTRISSPFVAGLLLGFLPCGLFYGALISASSMKTPTMAGAGMLFFGVGTWLSLFLVAIFGNFIMRYKNIFRFLNMFVIVLMGILFIYFGLRF